MRLNLLITCIAIAAVSIIMTFALTMFHGPLPEERVSAPVPDMAGEEADEKEVYWIREYKGKLGVFRGAGKEPVSVFDVYVSTLPPYDRGQLEQGVKAGSYQELLRRIEDYTS